MVSLLYSPLVRLGNSRYGGLRVQFVGLLGEEGIRQSASKVYLPHDGLPDHPVQARPVEQERPHVHRSVAIVGCGEACSCEDDDRSVLTGGYLYRSGQDCLTPYFRVVHIGIGHDRPLLPASRMKAVRISTEFSRR